jgi:transposase
MVGSLLKTCERHTAIQYERFSAPLDQLKHPLLNGWWKPFRPGSSPPCFAFWHILDETVPRPCVFSSNRWLFSSDLADPIAVGFVHTARRLIHIREVVAAAGLTGAWMLVSFVTTPKRKRGDFMNNISTLFVGIDVSKCVNVVRFMCGQTGDTLKLFHVPNNADGADKLLEKLRHTIMHTDYSKVTVGMEATSVYADHLANFLRNNDFLRKWECSVFLINARIIKNFKKSYTELPKTDSIDTLIIADYLRFGRSPKSSFLDEKYLALRNLTRARFQAAQNLSREKARFLDTLFQKFSTLDSSGVFSNTFGATSLAVITEFLTTDDIVNMPMDELATFISQKGKGKFTDPEAVAAALAKAARSSYRVSKTVNDSLNQLLSIRLIAIRSIGEQIISLDKSIASYMDAFQNVLISVPGIGKVYSAGIMAEIGDVSRFDGQAALSKYGGLAWQRHQSGNYDAANTQMFFTGNRYLKYYLLEAANTVRLHDTEFARYYRVKYREVHKHQHKRALALTAKKLVRLVYSLLSNNRLYTPPSQKATISL